MKIFTTRFGEIEVPDDRVMVIPDGILGFPGETRYVLLEHDSEGTPFKWLQSVDNPGLAFIVIDPHLVVEDYRVEFSDDVTALLGAREPGPQLATMSIIHIPREDPIGMTVNLRAPIVVNVEKRTGAQIILPNENYPIRHRLFPASETPSPTADAGCGQA